MHSTPCAGARSRLLMLAVAIATAAAVAAVPAPARAQSIAEIPAMTVSSSEIDMDLVGNAGPTTIAQVNAAGTNCGAALADIVLTPSTAAQGVYNTNPTRGRALARDTASNGLILVDPPSGAFGAFDARIELAIDCTEFGVGIGDWVGPVILDFFSKGSRVTSHTSTTYSTAAPKYYQLTGGTFDRVDIRASTTAGNWVIPDLITQIPASGFTPYGKGCAGTNGKIPYMAANAGSVAKIGTTLSVTVTNTSPTPAPAFFLLGASDTKLGALSLPIDLAPLGAGGCRVWTDALVSLGSANIGGSIPFSLPIPNTQALVGAQAYLQAFIMDGGANALNLTTSNGGHICVRQ